LKTTDVPSPAAPVQGFLPSKCRRITSFRGSAP
jgi:hypothetical protein